MENYNRISFNVDGTLKVKVYCVMFKEGDFFVSILPSLKLTARSRKSFEDSSKQLDDIVNVFIKINSNRDKLHKELSRLGWANNMPPKDIIIPTNILPFKPAFQEMEYAL